MHIHPGHWDHSKHILTRRSAAITGDPINLQHLEHIACSHLLAGIMCCGMDS